MFYPTIQERSQLALKWKAENQDGNTIGERKFPQSAILFSKDYGKFLDKQLMAVDPFYAINELFRFCTFSDAQFLNIMDASINAETGHDSMSLEKPTLTNLLYYQRMLESHLPRLRQNIILIKQHASSSWPHVSEENKNQHAKAAAAAEALLQDMMHLEQRTKDLLERCKTGMNILMNYVMLAESRQAISQGQRVAKLTMLAFMYVPISFTTSFFGMNVTQIVSGELSIWIWFVTSIPIFILSFSFFYIDFEKVVSFCKLRWKKFKLLF